MTTRRAYSRLNVKSVELESLLERISKYPGQSVYVGLDIGKLEIVAVVRWPDGTFDQPWSVANPSEIGLLVSLLVQLSEKCSKLTIGMESTGNYGEAVRLALTSANLEVQRVGNKGCSDFRELFDGVPSQHDGKDAAMIAELISIGKGTAWPYEPLSERQDRIVAGISRLESYHSELVCHLGRMEALVAKCWPELLRILSLNSATLIQIMKTYGCPRRLAADPECRANLRRWGRSGLKATVIDQIVASAAATMGLPQGAASVEWTQELAGKIYQVNLEIKACEKQLEEVIMSDQVSAQLASILGTTTLCVLLATVGDPKNYDSSGAFMKALGLNLTEFSSGKYRGQKKISKRGPGLARKYIYFWALRVLRNSSIRKWYDQFQKVGNSQGRNSEHRRMKGVVAIMRKLCRSLWYVHAHGLTFDYSKVFPNRPLEKPRRRRRRRQPVPQ